MLVPNRISQLALCVALLLVAGGPAEAQEKQLSAAAPVTFQGLVQHLRAGQSEQEILKLLEQSSLDVSFVLGDSQVAELKKMRVSDEFIEGVQKLLQKRTSTPASDVTDLVLILDCSGSMMDKTKDGLTKMQAAKQVVTELIQDFPAGRRLGLIVYGHDRARECQSVDVVRPLSVLDDAARAQLKQYVSRLQPSGHTPIARALEAATGEVAQAKGLSRVVLITDGMESCHGDPVAAAAALVEKTKANVDVIGFALKPEESKAIDRIAKAGRGKYYDAQTAEKLRKDLRLVAQVSPAQPEQPKPEAPLRPEQLPDELATFIGHQDAVTGVTFSRDGRRVVSACDEDHTVRQWDVTEKKELDSAGMQIRLGTQFVFSADGRRLLSHFGQSATLWNVDSKKEVNTINPFSSHVHSVAFSPNGRRFIVGHEELDNGNVNAYVDVWDAETGKRVQRFSEHKPRTATARFTSVCLSGDGQRAASANDDGVRVWDSGTGKQLQYLERPSVLSMAFSPDGRSLVTGEALDALILWDVETGKEARRFTGHSDGVVSVTFSTDGRHLLSGGEDKTVRLWDASSGQELHCFNGHAAGVTSVNLSADGQRAASGSQDKTARVWNISKYTAVPR
jgi:Mg-chelatase subunit ChlD